MKVDLVCLNKCYQAIDTQSPRLIAEGERLEGIEVDGTEGWLQWFNAYKPQEKVEVEVVNKQDLIKDFGVADQRKEERHEPKPEDIGGVKISLETIKEALTKEEMVEILHEAKMFQAKPSWKEDTLAKHIAEKQLWVGKL